jgi:nitroreductase
MTAPSAPRTPQAAVDPQFLDRWSPRAFRSDPLTPAQIASLFEAARWSPSCFNEQPWRIVYAARGEPEHATLVDLLVEANRVWAANAPLLLFFFARRNFKKTGKPNRTAAFDTGSAWMALALEARRLGLYAHGMAGYDAARSYPALGLPESDYESCCAVAVGALGDPADLPEKLREREFPSDREPAASFAFHGRFTP